MYNLFVMIDKIYKYFGSDGLLHIICSSIISSLLCLFIPIITSALITVIIGIAKEIIWDKLLKKGTFDKKDIISDLIGTIIGCI